VEAAAEFSIILCSWEWDRIKRYSVHKSTDGIRVCESSLLFSAIKDCVGDDKSLTKCEFIFMRILSCDICDDQTCIYYRDFMIFLHVVWNCLQLGS